MAFQTFYKEEVVPKLKEEFGYKNIHAVPTVKTVTLNVGLGAGIKDAKYIETAEKTLTRISGQKPVSTKARKSIAGFKIRQGLVVGMKVTLRGKRMWDFLEKLIKVSLPRVRDFRGLPNTSFDGQGNYSIGLKEHIAFPEIRSEEIDIIHGIQITISTSAKTDPEAKALLTKLGLPLKKEE
ncbi:50S ribosomal protein L5 [Candidatus Uhrbacteria bacterium CG10_big_fil_rev_8_21_14_0_10_48_16]|uniref:Large ribosomal subunit protein uL5 n=1 Tax=Candidatus Uhrbacteria bacterium CG10_big_fil_rev_8_21_14_0_10_48_16 TaxID=1975038 RepID=A0A2M8LGT2_9BACT|nr:MAG: 50S ribosomal protein L5 [Candidatus Uhrbacteria bacterium CG10_big_fil_rev_8_21_14_0_10_48_16]